MEEHNELNRTLGEILGGVKGINQRLDVVNGRLGKHDDKIHTLESFMDNVTGRFVVIGAVFALTCTIVGSWVNHTFFK